MSTAGTACVCTDCSKTAGYYLKAADGSCISTAITNCKTATIDGKTITCNICDFGYKWDTATSACLVCNQTTNKCATTGCASLDYPGKASAAGTTTAAANSALLKVIFGLLIAIITLLI